jgi:hypothetical protein
LYLRDLFVREPDEVPQTNEFPEFGRKLGNRPLNRIPSLYVAKPPERIGLGALVLGGGHYTFRVSNFERNGSRPLLPKLIDSGISGDAEEPGGELELRVVPVQSLENFQEDLLSQIQSVLAISNHPGDVRVNSGLVPPYEGRKELFFAAENSADELLIRRARTRRRFSGTIHTLQSRHSQRMWITIPASF